MQPQISDALPSEASPYPDACATVALWEQELYSYCVINFLRRGPLATGVAQHGHRERVLTSAMINLLRIVAIELGTWRSVLGGGASGSITFGNGKFFEPSGVTRS